MYILHYSKSFAMPNAHPFIVTIFIQFLDTTIPLSRQKNDKSLSNNRLIDSNYKAHQYVDEGDLSPCQMAQCFTIKIPLYSDLNNANTVVSLWQ